MGDPLQLHSFWTRPHFASDVAWRSEELVVWDFEMVTWLASALQARRHGRIRLVTDTRGLQFVRRTGLDWVYNAGISTELDEIPEAMDPQLFWAAAKLYALRRVDGPVLSLDTDALFWERFEPRGLAMALHAEDLRWAWYAENRSRYAPMGFAGPEWDWGLAPFTTGVLYLESPELAREYAGQAIGFMQRCSEVARGHSSRFEAFSDAMLFAEQRLLPMVLARHGVRLEALAERHPTECLLLKNPRCLHLWGTKAAYRVCPEARRAYRDYLAAFVAREHPEARETLARWRLGEMEVARADRDRCGGGSSPHCEFHLIREVRGLISIVDSNVEARRAAYPGAWVLPGETVESQGDGAFEIEVQGAGRLTVRSPGGG